MSLKHQIRLLARRVGVEVNRYDAKESGQARLVRQFQHHRVDVAIDVGANDGGYGQYLREGGFTGPIVSFEPLAQAHQALQHAARSDAQWHVAARMALGAADGEVTINVAGNSTSSSVLPMLSRHADAAPESRYIGAEQVPLRRLDGLRLPALDGGSRMLLKIDTQGYERAVLEGAEGLLPRVAGVQLELSCAPLYDGQVLYREAIDWLASRGYALWGIIPGFVDAQSGRMLQFDGIFFRDA